MGKATTHREKSKSKEITKVKKIQKITSVKIAENSTLEIANTPLLTSFISRQKLKNRPKSDIFKQFKEKFEEHKQTFSATKKFSKGQRKRLASKESFLKRKYLDRFIDDVTKDKSDARIDLKEFNTALNLVDEIKEEVDKKKNCFSIKKVQEIEQMEVKRSQEVLKHPQFLNNPFATLEKHITNNLKKKI